MRKSFTIFLQLCFICLGIALFSYLPFKAVEIEQASKIVRDFINPESCLFQQEDYTVSSEKFTTVIHVKKPITPYVCQRILKARIPYPHLFYSDNQVINVGSANACDNVNNLSIQLMKKRSFAHRLECFRDDQCETTCMYGFCQPIEEIKDLSSKDLI